MLFNTYVFVFVFLPVALAAFFLARRFAADAALIVAILGSFVFYAYWDVTYVPILCASIVLNYAAGTLILAKRGFERIVLATAIAADLGALGYFKYWNFFVAQLEWGLSIDIAVGKVALPLAISFYTFQQIAYLVDCYRGKIHDNAFLRYAFTVTFFPHLIAGPIVRMREIAPQFAFMRRRPVLTDLAVGIAVFIIGLGEKVILADYFGRMGSPVFAAAQAGEIDPISAWVGALAYTLQLYFDFSGYSNMAIGLSRMFGFRLAVNFLSPYKAASIAEFWRRWHITLSRFLRDYLYVPLGGSRAGPARTYSNLLITMTLGGLWHGASWTFVVWGLYHGILLCLHRAWRLYGHPIAPRLFGAMKPVWILITFLAVVAGWVLFRAADFGTAVRMLMAMTGLTGATTPAPYRANTYTALAAGLAICWLLPNVYQLFFRWRPALLLRPQIALAKPTSRLAYAVRFNTAEAVALSAILLFSLFLMRGTVSDFLYFMF